MKLWEYTDNRGEQIGSEEERKCREGYLPPIRADRAGNVYGIERQWANMFSL